MIEFRTLKSKEPQELLEVFNLSFSDYLIPLQLNIEQFKNKLKAENINLDYSVGAFENDKLVGFILHFYDESDGIKKVYNGGTGVVKEFRGNGLTKEMYKYIIPKLKQENIEYLVLEVLTKNIQAIKSYENVGFVKTREVLCFGGETSFTEKENPEISFQELKSFKWNEMTSFWDFEPTWQNSIPVIERISVQLISLGAFQNDSLVGYIIFNPETGKILQLAVDKEYRKRGIGKCLLGEAAKRTGGKLSAINVDESSVEIIELLKKIGLYNSVNQYELKLVL